MTTSTEKPWQKARRLFEDNFKEETFAETVLKNFERGLVYSDSERFVLAQEAETDGENIDIDGPDKNAWYVQLAVADRRPKALAGIMRVLPSKKRYVCFHRGAKSNRLKCYVWENLARKVGI